MQQQNSVCCERMEFVGSFPEVCLVTLFCFVVQREGGLFTMWFAIICWAYSTTVVSVDS